jgi:hypothetical protein
MRVATVSSWKADPARRTEFIRRLLEASAFHHKYGGRTRVWNQAIAGDTVGTIEYWIEHDDFEAYARFSAALARDAEYQELFRKLTEVDPCGHVIGTRLMHQIGSEN